MGGTPPGPEKYRKNWSTAPRKSPFCQESRTHIKGNQYIFDIKSLILMLFTCMLPGRRSNICACSQEAKQLFRPSSIRQINIIGVYMETNQTKAEAENTHKIITETVQRRVDAGENCVIMGDTNAAITLTAAKQPNSF